MYQLISEDLKLLHNFIRNRPEVRTATARHSVGRPVLKDWIYNKQSADSHVHPYGHDHGKLSERPDDQFKVQNHSGNTTKTTANVVKFICMK